MRVLTRQQSRELDRLAMEEHQISGESLMGAAGGQVAETVKGMLSGTHNPRVAVVCGAGNNGGDGLAAAAQLGSGGFQVDVYSLVSEGAITGDPEIFFQACKKKHLPLVCGPRIPASHPHYDLLVDALLGTGFKGAIRSDLVPWVEWINGLDCPVVSIDVPSGVDAETGAVMGAAVRADKTVTMGYLKTGLVLNPGRSYCGDLIPVEIGFPPMVDQLGGFRWSLFDSGQIKSWLPPIPPDTYKHRQGKVLILAGSVGMTGAAALTSLAALRAGAGLTVTCAPASLNAIYETKITEGMTLSCPDEGKGYLSLNNYSQIESYLGWCDALALGPGVGDAPETEELLEKLILAVDKPLVIDADGLRPLQGGFDYSRIRAPFVITPHPGELSLITGQEVEEVKNNFLASIAGFMTRFPGILVAKNAPTCTASGSEGVINTSGNPGLATGGTGDVLTGVIAALLAQLEQVVPIFEVVQTAVYLHGLAGDLAAAQHGQRGLLASDLLAALPSALRQYE